MSKVSALASAAAVADADLVYVVQGGVSKQATSALVRGRLASVLAANQTFDSITPANTLLSVPLLAGRTYAFRCVLFYNTAANAEGLRVDFDGGTATATAFRAQGVLMRGTTAATQVTLLATDMNFTGATGSGDDCLIVEGTIAVLAAGTFIPRIAKSTLVNPASTLYALSSLIAVDVTP